MFAAVNSLYSTDQQYGRVIICFILIILKQLNFAERNKSYFGRLAQPQLSLMWPWSLQMCQGESENARMS